MLLSIGMIVKNEEKTLRACLEGIKPILEQVDSELIIADTGSADGTAAIAREFTGNVYSVPWENDFAKARNATLERAKGLWYMFLDADEVFQDTADIIKFFNSGEYGKYRSASHFMINGEARDVFTRLYRVEKDTAFKGKIHEQIPLQPPVKRLGSVSLHTGYDFSGVEGAAKKAAKHERNMTPLLEMHRDNPSDLRVIALIVNETLSNGDLDEAGRFIEKGLSLRGKDTKDVFYHILRHYGLICLGRAGDCEKTAAQAEEYFKSAKKLFVCAIHMRLIQAHALTELGHPEGAAKAYEEALKLFSSYKTGRLDDEDVTMSVTSGPSPKLEAFAAGCLAGCLAELGNFDGARKWTAKYGLDVSELLAPLRRSGRGGLEEYIKQCVKYLNIEKLSERDKFIYHADKAYSHKEKGGALGFVSGLRDALKYDPTLTGAVMSAISAYNQEREDARARLDRETAAIKDAIYGFIKAGQEDTAGMVLERYAQVNPGDTDIKVISGIIERSKTDAGLKDRIELAGRVRAVFILSNLVVGGTGVINSVLRKVKLMEENWGARPLILTCEHNIELRRIRQVLRGAEDGKIGLGRRTEVLNVYEYFQNSYAPGLAVKTVYLNPDDGTERSGTEDKDICAAYEGGVLVRNEYYTGYENALRAVMHVENGRNARLVFYDDWGYVSKICHYDPSDDSRLLRVEFYTTSGRVCIKALYNYVNGENVPGKLTVYSEDGAVPRECAGDAGLAALCLERLLNDTDFYMLVVEDALMTADIERIRKKNVSKAIVVHAIFSEDPYDPRSAPNVHYKHLCGNPDAFDGIVFLTGAEREDFQKRYGRRDNMFVIPHPYPYGISRTDFNKRDHKKAVIVARFDPVKQIDMAIDIFAMAVKRLPGVKLEIYGFGSERERCLEQIKRMGLERNIALMGVTNDPAAVFGGAALSMMTSLAEGFPLTPVESVCNGCPVFAFDVKYGPSDIIEDGKTGYLFPPFDKERFAEGLVKYFEDEALQRTMSENAYADAGRFGTKAFMEDWHNLTGTIFSKNHPHII